MRRLLHAWQGPLDRGLRGGCTLGLLIGLALAPGGLLAQSQPAVHDSKAEEADVIQVTPQRVKADAAGELRIDLQFPEGYHLNPRAPLHYTIGLHGEGIRLAETDRTRYLVAPLLPLAIPFQSSPGVHQTTAIIDMTFYYCRADDTGVCAIQSVRWQVPLHTALEHTALQASVSYKAEAPVVQKKF